MRKYGQPPKNLSKEEIQNALDVSQSALAAARYLHVSYNTFKKYAKLHNVWVEGGKNPSAKGIIKTGRVNKRRLNLERLLNGDFNGANLNRTMLKERLLRECIFEEKCEICGYSERRITDQKVPLALVFKDGNYRNYKRENLMMICLNCRHNTIGTLYGKHQEYLYDPVTGDIIEEIIFEKK